MTKKTIWTIVIIVGAYVACQLIADVAATKFIEIGGVVMPGGTLIFALTFTLRDVVHKRLGREWARAAIVAAAGLNLLLAGYMYLVASIPSPVFYQFGESWDAIFAIVPAITIASIVAEVVSTSIDTEVYHFWKTKFPTFPQWTRVLTSNIVSLPIDTLVFSVLGFVLLPLVFGGEPMPLAAALARVISGQAIYKLAVTFVSMPLIYSVPDREVEMVAA